MAIHHTTYLLLSPHDHTSSRNERSKSQERPSRLDTPPQTRERSASDTRAPDDYRLMYSPESWARKPAINSREVADVEPFSRKYRTFRLSIPRHIAMESLKDFQDAYLMVGQRAIKRNCHVFSLAPYRSRVQVATVSFHREPDRLRQCQPDQQCTLEFALKERATPLKITFDCDFYGMTPVYHPPVGDPSCE